MLHDSWSCYGYGSSQHVWPKIGVYCSSLWREQPFGVRTAACVYRYRLDGCLFAGWAIVHQQSPRSAHLELCPEVDQLPCFGSHVWKAPIHDPTTSCVAANHNSQPSTVPSPAPSVQVKVASRRTLSDLESLGCSAHTRLHGSTVVEPAMTIRRNMFLVPAYG